MSEQEQRERQGECPPSAARPRIDSALSMGSLRHAETGDRALLLPEHLIGRSVRAALRLNNSYVSAQHALIRWVDDHWELKDLGSRNGTRVDGERLVTGKVVRLILGMRISFGRDEQTWVLTDDSPPRAVVVPLDDPDNAIVIDHEMVPLPSADVPAATILRRSDGSWNIEQHDNVATLVDGQILDVEGRKFRFACPKAASSTSTIDWPHAATAELQLASLKFRISPDEEHVQVLLSTSGEEFDLGARSHNYLLLHLARQRLAEAERGLTDSVCGWVHRDALLHALRLDREQLNLDVFRIRKHFAIAGAPNAAGIIERRSGTGELRIGLKLISIEGA